jgi:hypothetical protein
MDVLPIPNAKCQRCNTERVLFISMKVCDFSVFVNDKHRDAYIPTDIGLGEYSSDYLEFEFCLQCGQIQGLFPVPPSKLEQGLEQVTSDEEGDYSCDCQTSDEESDCKTSDEDSDCDQKTDDAK